MYTSSGVPIVFVTLFKNVTYKSTYTIISFSSLRVVYFARGSDIFRFSVKLVSLPGTMRINGLVFQVIEFFSGFKIDARIYILAMFPFVYGLGYVPNLMYLTPFSIIGFLFMFVGICVTLYYLLNDFPDPGRLQAFTHVLPAPMYCTLMLYALHNVTMCMPLENTMKNPLHLPRLITFSMLLNTLMYTVFGFLGYNKYTNRTCDTIIKNLPIEEP